MTVHSIKRNAARFTKKRCEKRECSKKDQNKKKPFSSTTPIGKAIVKRKCVRDRQESVKKNL